MRRRFETTMAIPPALTVALDKSTGGMHQGVALMCLGTTAPKQAFKSTLATGVELDRSPPLASCLPRAPGFDRDGFDAFAAADAASKAGGGGLDTAVQCLFLYADKRRSIPSL